MAREILKRLIPRTLWSSVWALDLVPPNEQTKKLVQWGGVGVFTVFWLVGDRSFSWAKSLVVQPDIAREEAKH
jgi:hypothetical protein